MAAAASAEAPHSTPCPPGGPYPWPEGCAGEEAAERPRDALRRRVCCAHDGRSIEPGGWALRDLLPRQQRWVFVFLRALVWPRSATGSVLDKQGEAAEQEGKIDAPRFNGRRKSEGGGVTTAA